MTETGADGAQPFPCNTYADTTTLGINSETSTSERDSPEVLSDERLTEIRYESKNDRWEFSYDGGDAVRELLAEVDRLNGVLHANIVVRNAAESTGRVYKSLAAKLRGERDQARTELAAAYETVQQNVETARRGIAELGARAETAERGLAEMPDLIAAAIRDFPGPNPSPADPTWWAGYKEAQTHCADIAAHVDMRKAADDA